MNGTTNDIDTILEKYPSEPRYLISALQDVQAEYHYISPENLNLICDHVGVSPTQAWAVATFYKAFSLEPRGEHVLKICCGTACHLKGGKRIIEQLGRELKIQPGETTPDLKFTLETVNCLGACALAPVAVVDEQYHAKTNAGKLGKVLKKLSSD